MDVPRGEHGGHFQESVLLFYHVDTVTWIQVARRGQSAH